MICPECHAEYRDSFTVCADCELPLVATLPSNPPMSSSVIECPTGPITDARSVWRGEDQETCVALCLQLRDAGIPYSVSQNVRSRLDRMRVAWRYEIFVSAVEEIHAKQSLDFSNLVTSDEKSEDEIAEESQDSADDFPATDDPNEDPFCAFWEGDDTRICAEICSLLDEAAIPHRVLRREPNLFRLGPHSQMKIGVPFSLYQKAEIAVVEAFGTDKGTPLLTAPGAEPDDSPSK